MRARRASTAEEGARRHRAHTVNVRQVVVYNNNLSVVELAQAGYHTLESMTDAGADHLVPLASAVWVWALTLELRAAASWSQVPPPRRRRRPFARAPCPGRSCGPRRDGAGLCRRRCCGAPNDQ